MPTRPWREILPWFVARRPGRIQQLAPERPSILDSIQIALDRNVNAVGFLEKLRDGSRGKAVVGMRLDLADLERRQASHGNGEGRKQ